MTIYKQPGSPYYYYDFYFESGDYSGSTHLRNKSVAHRVECIKKGRTGPEARGNSPEEADSPVPGFCRAFSSHVKVERRANTHRAYLSCVP